MIIFNGQNKFSYLQWLGEFWSWVTFRPKYYYYDSKNFGSVDGYERHVVIRHPNLPGYPGPVDIKFYGIEIQDMSWEREIKADFGWKKLVVHHFWYSLIMHVNSDEGKIEIGITDDHDWVEQIGKKS